MITKELIRDVDMTEKTVTSRTTKVNDVFEPGDVILAVYRNSKDRCGLVQYRYEFEQEEDVVWKTKLTVMSPTFSSTAHRPHVFDSLWELQGFFDLYVFKDFANLEGFMKDEKLEWEKEEN